MAGAIPLDYGRRYSDVRAMCVQRPERRRADRRRFGELRCSRHVAAHARQRTLLHGWRSLAQRGERTCCARGARSVLIISPFGGGRRARRPMSKSLRQNGSRVALIAADAIRSWPRWVLSGRSIHRSARQRRKLPRAAGGRENRRVAWLMCIAAAVVSHTKLRARPRGYRRNPAVDYTRASSRRPDRGRSRRPGDRAPIAGEPEHGFSLAVRGRSRSGLCRCGRYLYRGGEPAGCRRRAHVDAASSTTWGLRVALGVSPALRERAADAVLRCYCAGAREVMRAA
jgi:hypothetical protein